MCARCRAATRAAKLPLLEHDLNVLEMYQQWAHKMDACCSISGLSLLALKKLGDQLSVDRICSNQGYVEGNVRLLALSLNTAKGALDEVPQSAIRWLMGRWEGVARDRLSKPRGRAAVQ